MQRTYNPHPAAPYRPYRLRSETIAVALLSQGCPEIQWVQLGSEYEDVDNVISTDVGPFESVAAQTNHCLSEGILCQCCLYTSASIVAPSHTLNEVSKLKQMGLFIQSYSAISSDPSAHKCVDAPHIGIAFKGS